MSLMLSWPSTLTARSYRPGEYAVGRPRASWPSRRATCSRASGNVTGRPATMRLHGGGGQADLLAAPLVGGRGVGRMPLAGHDDDGNLALALRHGRLARSEMLSERVAACTSFGLCTQIL